MKDVPSTGICVFVDTMVHEGKSIHENGRFCGQSNEIDDVGQKIGPFLGREGQTDSFSQEKTPFSGRKDS